MILLTRKDFDSRSGQEKIVKTIHQLESKIHELEKTVYQLSKTDEMHEKDLHY